MKKQKVFIESGALVGKMSGVGNVALHLVRGLSMSSSFLKNHSIILLVPFDKVGEIASHKFNNVAIKKIWLPAKILNGLMRYNLLPPMDLLLGSGTYVFPNFKNWRLSKKSRAITYIHDVVFKIYPEFVEPKNLKMLNELIPTAIKRSSTIITVSESSKLEIVRYFPEATSKLRVVYNGVDLNVFKRRVEAKKTDLGLPKKYFAFVSNLEPRKNVGLLLDAYEALNNKNIGLVLASSMGWLSGDIKGKIKQLQDGGFKVVLDSYRENDLANILSGAVALVHPAFHEGFGLSPLEALACGTPVVVSDMPSIREVVCDNGIYIEDLKHPKELCGLLSKLVNGSIKYDKQELRKQAERFSWAQSVSGLIDIIDE